MTGRSQGAANAGRGMVLACGLALAACGMDGPPASAPVPPPPGAAVAVSAVERIDVLLNRKQPPGAVLVVKGLAATSGWGEASLEPLSTPAPTPGELAFTLVAVPPPGDAMVLQVLTPVEARLAIDPLPEDVRQIRVVTQTNTLTAAVPR